jgi:hypothetical protein
MVHFFDLPRELRDQIYFEALTSSHHQIWPCSSPQVHRLRPLSARLFTQYERNGDPYEARCFTNAALLRVNKQIYHEAKEVIIKANHVLFRPGAKWPNPKRRFQNHITEALQGHSSLVKEVDLLKYARSLTLDPASFFQLETMVRIIKKRTIQLTELVVTVRRICYAWDPDDFPTTEQEIEELFVCLEGVKARKVRIEWPTYAFVRAWSRTYEWKSVTGWPVPVTNRIVGRMMSGNGEDDGV